MIARIFYLRDEETFIVSVVGLRTIRRLWTIISMFMLRVRVPGGHGHGGFNVQFLLTTVERYALESASFTPSGGVGQSSVNRLLGSVYLDARVRSQLRQKSGDSTKCLCLRHIDFVPGKYAPGAGPASSHRSKEADGMWNAAGVNGTSDETTHCVYKVGFES